MHKSLDEFEIRSDPTRTTELPALERLKKSTLPLFSRLFFIHSFSYLQVMIACMGARRSSKIDQIRPPTAELAALERLKNPHRHDGKNGVATFSQLFLPRFFQTCR